MQAFPTNYENDVFVSYKRNFLIEKWVTNYFLRYFEEWLEEKLQALGEQPPRIFFDQRNVEPGDPWPLELQRGIQTAKILVAICSPSYFHSPWCKSEWESFVQRQQQLGRHGLIIPVRHNDSEQFLQGITWSDFYGYTFLTEGFYQSAQAAEFERKIEALAGVVAHAVQAAPQFQPNWPAPLVNPNAPLNPTMRQL